jgi:hypothetical protein
MFRKISEKLSKITNLLAHLNFSSIVQSSHGRFHRYQCYHQTQNIGGFRVERLFEKIRLAKTPGS